MPQPTVSQVHVQAALTQIAVAYIQDNANYVADKIFPVVPVEHQTDFYFKFTKDDWFRDEAQIRADATESAGGGFNLDATSSYAAKVWAFHKDVGNQTRRNADPAVDIDIAATKFVMQKMMIRKDRFFVGQFLQNGVWGTDIAGVTSAPSGSQAIYWNDDANGDPFTDIQTGITTVLQNTGREPNMLALGYPVYAALRKHPLVIDRIKYTTRADASKITPELMASAFDVEQVVVSKAVYNSAAEGAAGTYSFVASKDALLCYSAPSPGLMEPSAGYTFAWNGLAAGLNNLGVRIAQIPLPWLGLETLRTEGEMAFDSQVIGADLGYHFSGIVQ